MKEDIVQQDYRRLSAFWSERTSRIKDMYSLRRLTDQNKKEKFESFVANDPATFLRLATHLISFMPPIFRIPLTQDEEQRNQSGKAERALVSLWRELDMKQRKLGRQAWRRQFSDILLTTGWYAVLATVIKDDDGSPIFIADVWNPADVFQEWDNEGLSTVIHSYALSIPAAEKKAGEYDTVLKKSAKSGSTIRVYDWWKKEDGIVKHALKIGEQMLVEPKESIFKEIPVITGPVIGEATWGGFSPTDRDWVKYYGQSIFEPNYDLYLGQDKWFSWCVNWLKEHAYPMTLDRAEGGSRVPITKEDIQAGKLLHLAPGQTIDKVPASPIPVFAETMLAIYTSLVQRGSFPWVMYGSTPFRMSGTALNQLLETAHTVVGPYLDTLKAITGDISYIWLTEFKEGNMKPIKIAGRSKSEGSVGAFFQEEFTPKDVPDTPFVEVAIKLSLPSDLMERISIARVAKPQGDLLDTVTVLDELLEQQDPMRILERIHEDTFRNSDIMQRITLMRQLQAKAERLRLEGREEEAVLLEQYIAGLMGPPQGQGGAVPPERLRTAQNMGQTSETRRLQQYIEGQGASPQYGAMQRETQEALNQYKGVE